MRKVLTSARRHWRLRSATALALSGALAASLGIGVAWSSATADEVRVHKSYVCKYVGKPGVDERLQTGNNPIWVDNNSLPGYHDDLIVEVGMEFADAQGKSVVIIANTPKLNPEPGIEACFEQITVPARPATVDPCNEVGVTSNIAFVVPQDTDQLDWTLLPNGDLKVAPKYGYRFPGSTQEIVFQLPADSGVPCELPSKDPVTATVTQNRSTCDLGVEQRSGSQTTTFTWNPAKAAFDEQVGPVSWGAWTFVRDLTEAEFEALDCRPDQPEPNVLKLTDERMGCDIGVQEREGSQTTSYIWNAETRAYDAVVGAEVWGEWTKVRDLTTEEFIALECVAGEETVVPKPEPEPKPETTDESPDREPVVLGTEASVPTAVAAGLAGDTGLTTSELLGQGLAGMGLVLMLSAGWLAMSRRTRGEHLI